MKMISSIAQIAAHPLAAALLAVAVVCSGCAVSGHTAKRAALTGLGAAAGGAAGYAIGDHKPAAVAAGAVGGAILTNAALGDDKGVYQDGFDEGYVQGQSDAIKRQYFLRQALEQTQMQTDQNTGKKTVYVVPGPKVTTDGRKLEDHKVAIEVVE